MIPKYQICTNCDWKKKNRSTVGEFYLYPEEKWNEEEAEIMRNPCPICGLETELSDNGADPGEYEIENYWYK